MITWADITASVSMLSVTVIALAAFILFCLAMGIAIAEIASRIFS